MKKSKAKGLTAREKRIMWRAFNCGEVFRQSNEPWSEPDEWLEKECTKAARGGKK